MQDYLSIIKKGFLSEVCGKDKMDYTLLAFFRSKNTREGVPRFYKEEIKPEKHREEERRRRKSEGIPIGERDLSISWRDEWQTFFPRLLH